MNAEAWAWPTFLVALAAISIPTVYALWPQAGKQGKGEAALLGSLIAYPQFIVIAKLLFLIGLPVSLWGLLLVAMIHTAVSLLWGRVSPPLGAPVGKLSPVRFLLLYYVAFALFAFAVALYAITESYGDSLFYWVARGWSFAVGGNVHLFSFLAGRDYPLGVPLGHMPFLLLENGLGVGLWQHLFLMAVLFYVLIYLVRRYGASGLLVGSLFLVPQVIALERMGSGLGLYADTTLAASLLLSVVVLAQLLDGDRSRWWVAAVALSFFAFTKVNAAFYLIFVFGSFALALRLRGTEERSIKRDLKLLASVFLPPVSLLLMWRVVLYVMDVRTGIAQIGGAVLVGDVLSSSSPLNVLGHKVALSVSYFLETMGINRLGDPAFFRKLGWVIVFGTASLAAWPWLVRRERFVSLCATGILLSIVLAVYVLIDAGDDSRAGWWFRTGYNRAIVHVLPLSVLTVELILSRLLAGLSRAFPNARKRETRAIPPRKWAMTVLLLFPIVVGVVIASNRDKPFIWKQVLDDYIPRPNRVLRVDDYGLYEAVEFRDEAIRWSAELVDMKVLRKGTKLRVRYSVAHPGVSAQNPVRVRTTVAGKHSGLNVVEEQGVYEAVYDLSDIAEAVIDFQVRTSPTWIAPDGREIGVALFPFRWE